MTTAPAQDEERAAFEAWFKREFNSMSVPATGHAGDLWAAWKQARATAAEGVVLPYSPEDMWVFGAIVKLLDEGFMPSTSDKRWEGIKHWASKRLLLAAAPGRDV